MSLILSNLAAIAIKALPLRRYLTDQINNAAFYQKKSD